MICLEKPAKFTLGGLEVKVMGSLSAIMELGLLLAHSIVLLAESGDMTHMHGDEGKTAVSLPAKCWRYHNFALRVWQPGCCQQWGFLLTEGCPLDETILSFKTYLDGFSKGELKFIDGTDFWKHFEMACCCFQCILISKCLVTFSPNGSYQLIFP